MEIKKLNEQKKPFPGRNPETVKNIYSTGSGRIASAK